MIFEHLKESFDIQSNCAYCSTSPQVGRRLGKRIYLNRSVFWFRNLNLFTDTEEQHPNLCYAMGQRDLEPCSRLFVVGVAVIKCVYCVASFAEKHVLTLALTLDLTLAQTFGTLVENTG